MYPYELFLGIHMYGVMVAIGIACCLFSIDKLAKKLGASQKFVDFVEITGLFAIAGGFASATLFQSIYDYIENPSAGFTLDSGMTFIGGLIGGVITFLVIYLLSRKKFSGKDKLMTILPAVPMSIIIAHAWGRVGCFFAGCCHGVETDAWYGVQFVGMSHKVIPTNLMEAIFLFILFGVLLYLFLKHKFKYTMPVYLIAYGIFRFSLEFLRGDHRGELVGNISPSQFWSIIMFVIGIGLIFYLKYYYKKELAKEQEEEKAQLN